MSAAVVPIASSTLMVTSGKPKALNTSAESLVSPPLSRSRSNTLHSPSSGSTAVWRTARAKDVFKQFDANKDKILNKVEFTAGLQSFISLKTDPPPVNDTATATTTPQVPTPTALTATQIEALWNETDINGDGRITLEEFLYRFAGGPHPDVSAVIKPTIALQKPLKPQTANAKISVEDLRNVLFCLYDGPKIRKSMKTVDLSKTEQVSNTILKRVLTQILQCEVDEATKSHRAMEDWAKHIHSLGGIVTKDVDKLFAALDVNKSGRVDLAPIFAEAKMRPSQSKIARDTKQRALALSRSKQNGFVYPLASVNEDNVIHWCNDAILNSLTPQHKCHPPLPHWGTHDRNNKSLTSGGYQTHLLLSERTKLKSIVPFTTSNDVNRPLTTQRSESKSGYVICLTCRCEMTSKARLEFFYFVRIELDENERMTDVQVRLKKSWSDSAVEVEESGDVFDDWNNQFNLSDDTELSVPPLT